jgi:AcrR family transcriptional regulator
MARRPRRIGADPREAILRIAREEFAARGFAAARVETLARRARVNKALIYYYFGSKLGLYRHVVRLGVAQFVARMRAIVDADLSATEKVQQWIDQLAAHFIEEPSLPRVMLREVADGGSHLDADTLRDLTSILPLLHQIVRQGQDEGAFDAVDPIALHFVLMGSTLLFTTNGPIRKRVRQLGYAQPPLDIAPFVSHLHQFAIRSLRKDHDHAETVR